MKHLRSCVVNRPENLTRYVELFEATIGNDIEYVVRCIGNKYVNKTPRVQTFNFKFNQFEKAERKYLKLT
jgi:hypothetical protein